VFPPDVEAASMMPSLIIALAATGATILSTVCAWTRFRLNGTVRDSFPLPLVLVAFVLLVHYAFPRQHRIFFDEDAYVSISRNTLAGHPGHLTLGSLPSGTKTVPYKWPIAFPVLAWPWIHWLGPETGPAVLNELCGAATLLWVMWLGYSLSGSRRAALWAAAALSGQPVALAWFRSGSSEPVSTVFTIVALSAGWFARSAPGLGLWPAVSLLATAVAVQARLENLLLLLPVVFLLCRSRRPIGFAATVGAEFLLASSIFFAARHYFALSGFYWAGLPESFFSWHLFLPNLWSNLAFLASYATSTALLSCVAVTAILFPAAAGRSAPAAILFLAAASSGLLLFYSCGQYGAPGESRFLLLVAPAVSVVASGLLARLPLRTSIGVASLAGAAIFLQYQHAASHASEQWVSVSREHDAIRSWASTLPTGATVISRLPYIWDNFGVQAVLPEDRPPQDSAGPLYFHFGLVNQPAEWPEGQVPQRKIVTDDGAVCLFRFR
jgi:hypothetical protein